MVICPCSPDVGDCSKCTSPQKNLIQNVVSTMKTEVSTHPKKYALKTRRRAQFLKNIRKPTRKNLRRK